jgi:hypothetical protein
MPPPDPAVALPLMVLPLIVPSANTSATPPAPISPTPTLPLTAASARDRRLEL